MWVEIKPNLGCSGFMRNVASIATGSSHEIAASHRLQRQTSDEVPTMTQVMPLAATNKPGTVPSPDTLVNVPRLITAYYAIHPDPNNTAQRVAFGTSGHRGSAFNGSFNDDHIAAITQAIVDYRRGQGIGGAGVRDRAGGDRCEWHRRDG